MKKEIVGIVVEFNPLHNGHKHLIDTVKKERPNSLIVAAMSGQFVQRGEVSIFDKWERAKRAVELGIDLVIEIPPYFVLNNANIFAKKAMEIFKDCGVNEVFFGSETLTINKMESIVEMVLKDENRLSELNKLHHSLPKAFEEFIGEKLNPNDTLGICYILEANKLGYDFKFNRVLRESNEIWSSASKIRKDLWNGVENNRSLIESNNQRNLDDYSEIVIGKLVTSNSNDDIINYLSKIAIKEKVTTVNELIDKSHNSSYTKARLRRELMKFTLELEGSDNKIILSANNNGKDILRDIDEYEFRHNKNNQDNYIVERFLSLKSKAHLKDELGKSTIFII